MPPTGAILSYDFDAENYIPQQNTGSYIGAEKAKSVALAHAGVSQSQVTRLRCELEKDDGRWEYQVNSATAPWNMNMRSMPIPGPFFPGIWNPFTIDPLKRRQ